MIGEASIGSFDFESTSYDIAIDAGLNNINK